MKILTADQLKTADKITLKNKGISSLELMEHAAGLAFQKIHASLDGAEVPIKVFCGVGNNGGDGLVIARLLIEKGYRVAAFVVNYSEKRSAEFLANYDRIKEMGTWPELLTAKSDFPIISKDDLVIDAIFGIGLNRPLENWTAKLIEHINASNALIIAIDIPSGLFLGKVSPTKNAIVKAAVTLTFHCPKLVFFLPETSEYIGNFHVIDIGLDQKFLQNLEGEIYLVENREAKSYYRFRKKFSHKGTYGHSLIVGGSYGKIGSIVLAATAAFRAGAGKVTAFVPKCGYDILQISLPEAMVTTSDEDNFLVEKELDFDPETICFGMGAGKNPETVRAFEKILKNANRPMIIDADGLNILSENKRILEEIPPKSILTPHPKELERLIGKWKNDFDKLEKAKKFSQKHKVVLVIKGAYSTTIWERKMYINHTGNPGMATAGSGDVLAGAIAGLLAQGYDPLVAAIFGVYLHGKAGDFASRDYGLDSMMAGEITEYLSNAFLDLFKKAPKPERK